MTDPKLPDVSVRAVSPVLPVRDVAAALARYQAMGFIARAYVHGEQPPFYGFVCMGPTEFHVSRVDGLDPATTTSELYLYVDDADDVFARWRDAVEGRFHPPRDTEYGLREFGYVDPDGNSFRVGSPIDEPTDAE